MTVRELDTMGILPPFAVDPGAKPELCFLPVASLRVDPAYQRPITKAGRKTIEKIVDGFQWAKFAPLIVTPIRDGLYAIIDGQHRATAALICGFDRLPCNVVDAGAAEASAIFAAVNGTVTPLSVLALFRAARAAGEPWARGVQAACDAAGIEPLTHPVPRSRMKPRQTIAIGTLRKVVAQFGVETVGRVLAAEMARPGADVPGYLNSDRVRQAVLERAALAAELPARPGDMDVTVNDRTFRMPARWFRLFDLLDKNDVVPLADLDKAWGGSVRGLERVIAAMSRQFNLAGAEIVLKPGEGYALQNIEEAA